MAFIKNVEDFTCGNCSAEVKGTGYTNHCPKCLWSKHVDVDPGDRAEACGGMMQPIAIEGTVARYRLVHKCAKCSMVRRVDVSEMDDVNALLALAGKHV